MLCCDTLCTPGFVDDVHTTAMEQAMQKAYTQSDSLQATLPRREGAECGVVSTIDLIDCESKVRNTQFTPPRRRYKTVLPSRVGRCELGIKERKV